ncbi:MAG TPA: dipeptide epimerase [Longimicrobiales bacterium]|nr:dipeptide epimerase [Longimicrobiales bacterium]
MAFSIRHEVMELTTTHAFNIARAAAPPVRRTVWVKIQDGTGAEGWGEAAANAYYGETADTVIALLPLYERALNDSIGEGDEVLALERAEAAVERVAGRNPAARAAVSAALHDLAGKRLGLPVWQMWGLDAQMPMSSFTIGIDEPDAMVQRLEEASSYSVIKMKVGSPGDRRALELIRKHAPDRTIRIDANTGWSVKQAVALLPLLEELGIELIEQPFKSDDIESFRLLRERSSIPVIADESCRTAADIPRLVGAVDGINIKLEKCGSLREALRMVHIARAHHLNVMMGCMLCSTLGIAAAMQIAPLVDWTDLDGAVLLSTDPFRGPSLERDGTLRLNSEPGLGVARR